MTHTTPLTGGAIALLLLAASALAADGPPTLDIASTCKTAASAGVGDNASEDGCLRSERAAHDEVKRRWGAFTRASKVRCEKQFEAGGSPSYVEMVTCLELANGSVPTRPDGRGTDTGADSGKPAGPSSSVGEPSPGQRTNPIEVLGKPSR